MSAPAFHFRDCPFYGSTSDQLDGCVLQLRQGQAEERAIVQRLEAWSEGLRAVRDHVPAAEKVAQDPEQQKVPAPEVFLW